jgi:hypothetical protein
MSLCRILLPLGTMEVTLDPFDTDQIDQFRSQLASAVAKEFDKTLERARATAPKPRKRKPKQEKQSNGY